ncbi:MAG: GDP-L-fucose synthase [Candidatus Micrarchaeota archaeon]
MELEGKRVLITGAHGFLGRPLLALLKGEKPEGIIAPLSSEYDLRKEEDARRLFEKERPQVVIHAAARVGGIEYNRKNPASVYYDNLMINTNVVHCCHLHKVQKLVAVGSVCSYPKNCPIPTKEESLWDGYPEETNAPYGLAKKIMLVQMQAYRAQYGLSGAHLLQVNLYGPGDHFNGTDSHVIAAMIYKFEKAKRERLKKVLLWGDGSPTREFLYVDDAARAIILAAKKMDSPLPANVGSGEEISIRNLSQIISREIGYGGKIEWDATKPNGQPRRLFDSGRAKELFGFEAQVKFEEGLKKTVKWYLENREKVAGK